VRAAVPALPPDLDLASRAGAVAVLRAFGVQLRPARGQHLLVSRHILDRIVAAAALEPGDVVLEIGGGIGTLTQALARTGARVITVEVDPRLVPVLRAVCGREPRVHVVHGDAMTLPWTALPWTPTAVVANLPYAIASPLLVRLLEAGTGRRLVVMVQEEVADRLLAAPGTPAYGLLTVLVQLYARPTLVVRVPRTAFYPMPQVRSAVVRLDVHARPVRPPDRLPEVVAVARAAFAQRRKMLRAALREVGGRRLDAAAVVAWCARAGIDPRRRGETLSVEEFARLADVREDVRERE
jgi:16S rRNA (adenine1518-N6/adenine1519-N6)-dimethyltransferase